MGRRSKESLIAERLTTPFQKELFAAVIRSLQQLDNPLRANNFATGLRELSRIILAYLAPDADVRACAWFKPEIPNGSPTRSQRVKYAVQAGLMDDFVRNTLKVDVEKTIKRFTKLIERLSSLTHITESRFGMSKTAAKKFANESLDVFIALFQTIDECHDNVLERLITAANDAITDELISYSVDALEEIATHYTVDGSEIENLEIAKMDSTTLVFDAEGFVDCVLQYGSDGDVERGDGMRHDDSYPLRCKLVADIAAPLTFEVQNLRVDNSSFYE
jgi:Predicted pPIWI-associating nuclease